ncbi:MAG: hypothetical protein WA906_09070 [Pacificimonas sp.]
MAILRRDDWLTFFLYLIGGAGLCLAGPEIWGVSAEAAIAASVATCLVFVTGHWGMRLLRVLADRRQRPKRRSVTAQAARSDTDDDACISEKSADSSSAESAVPSDDMREPFMIIRPIEEDAYEARTRPTALSEFGNTSVDRDMLAIRSKPIVALRDLRPRHLWLDDDTEKDDFWFVLAQAISIAEMLAVRSDNVRLLARMPDEILASEDAVSELHDVVTARPQLRTRLVPVVSAELATASAAAHDRLLALTVSGFEIATELSSVDQLTESLPGTVRSLSARLLMGASEGQMKAARRCGLTVVARDVRDATQIARLDAIGVSLACGSAFMQRSVSPDGMSANRLAA